MKLLKQFLADESGATTIEYGLIAGLISVVVVSAVTNVGKNANLKFQAVANNLK